MIIGISGKMAVGKTTAAKILQEINPALELKSFAGPLKDVAKMFLGDIDLSDQEVKASNLGEEWSTINPYQSNAGWIGAKETIEQQMTVREFLQKLGTDAIRNGLHPNAWVNMLFKDYTNQNWVIDDVRFPNEMNAIIKRGGVVIRMTRDDAPKSYHASEIMLDMAKFDYYIDNNNTIATLRLILRSIMNGIHERDSKNQRGS